MSSQLIGRRQFLVMSSTCALATAVIGPNIFAGEAAAGPPRKLAVGFTSFEDGTAVRAAAGLASGDGAFIGRGARIVVSGASGRSATLRDRRGVELLAHYPFFDGAERQYASFRAWSGSRTVDTQGNSVGFTIPVDEVQKISLSLVAEFGSPAAARSAGAELFNGTTEVVDLPLTLSVQNERGAYPLVRGFYVVVPLVDKERDPRWSEWTVARKDGRLSLVDESGAPASFEHFVLKIDYASA